MRTLADTVLILEAMDLAGRRGATAQEIVTALNALHSGNEPAMKPVTYFCNKCGAFPPTSEHLRPNSLSPCGYLAAPSDWKERSR